MSIKNGRLERLYPALSAKERAILVLRAAKEYDRENPLVRSTMPHAQADEFNRLVGLTSAANLEMGLVVFAVSTQVQQLDLKMGWLATLEHCAAEFALMGGYIAGSTKEPVTETQYRERERELRAEMLPLRECALIATEGYEGWATTDYVTNEHGVEQISNAAWNRVLREKKREIASAVASGALEASGKGSRLRIACGAFRDWLGIHMPVFADWGSGYDVYPDDQADEVERLRLHRESARDLLKSLSLETRTRDSIAAEGPTGTDADLARALVSSVRHGIVENWCELRAVEIAIADVQANFGDEDVLGVGARTMLEDSKEMLVDLHARIQKYVGDFDLAEPS